MKDLNYSTQILLKHYSIWTADTKIKEIMDYNNHKIRHSIWVLEYGRLILLKINNISEEYKKDSEISFLLHDLWRFYQNNGEKVLSGQIFEHGDSWYNIAKKEWYDEEICLAIKYHNKLSINWLYEEKSYINFSKEQKEKTNFLVNITRDADKLENMIYTIYNLNHFLSLDSSKPSFENIDFDITKECLYDILNKKLVDRKNEKTTLDKALVLISWVFDINFKETKDILIENDFLSKIKLKFKNTLSEDKFLYLENIFEICELELNK